MIEEFEDEPLDLFKGWTAGQIESMKIRESGNFGYTWSEETRVKVLGALTGMVRSPEFCKKVSEATLGKPKSASHRRHISEAKLGQVFSEEHIRHISESAAGRRLSEEHKEAISRANTGRVLSPETIRRVSEAQRKRLPLNEAVRKQMSESHTGLTRSQETKDKISRANLGKTISEEQKKAESETQLKRWANLSDEEYSKWVKANQRGQKRKPNWDEYFLGVYLEENFPGEWAYNGAYQQGITIGRKVPDFVNMNGKKAVVEMLGHFRHPDVDEGKLVEHYKRYGYKCTVVWEEVVHDKSELDKMFGRKGLG